MNLGNQPVEVLVEDVYLLVVPSSESSYDPEEEESRKQAAKFERLENAELLNVRTQTAAPQGQQAAGLELRRESILNDSCFRQRPIPGSILLTRDQDHQQLADNRTEHPRSL